MSASFVDDADGFVAAFGSLTEWNHVDRAGNDLAGVAPIAEGTDRLSAGPKAPTGFQPGRRHRPAVSRGEGTDSVSAGQRADRLRAGLCPLRSLTPRTGLLRHSVR